MKAFMRNFGPSSSIKEKVISDNLIVKLSESVKYIQVYENDDQFSDECEGDGTTSLCSVLEAIFLHGFKDSFLVMATKALSTDIDQRPEPSFWPFLLVFSHSQIILQIEQLSQVNCEVGYCRAWIRIALNDNLLSSYLSAMKRDSHILKQFYKSNAFIRDSEYVDVAENLLSGIEVTSNFKLAINSSLLNYWNQSSLIMAGVWSLSLKSCPVQSGVDVASSITESAEVVETTLDKSEILGNGIGQITALNEGEALRIILEKEDESECESANTSGIGNSLSGLCGWSSEQSDTTKIESSSEQSENSKMEETFLSPSEVSYNVILDNYNKSSAFVEDVNLFEELHESFNSKPSDPTDEVLQGYEVISINSLFSNQDFNYLVSFLSRIAVEKGLDNQRYICGTCGNTLGISFAKPRVCSFTGEYFCDDCMSDNLYIIPARVIFNWDFRNYPVSKKSESFILEFKNHPLINIKLINPNIYSIIDAMTELQSLRVQLNFLRAYLYTCREPVIEELQRKVWPREYLFESVHQYSISDLEQIGQLTIQLNQIINFARSHVNSCWLCAQKGFICEMCKAPKVLYPYDLATTYRCDNCNALFHRDCVERNMECPKCKRRRERDNNVLL